MGIEHGSPQHARTRTGTGSRRWSGALAVLALVVPIVVAAPVALAEVATPAVSVQPDYNAIWTEGWEPGTELAVTVSDDAGGVPGTEWMSVVTHADGEGTANVAFEADGLVDFPGRHFEVEGIPAGGATPVTKAHHVPLLTLEVDPETAVASGTTDLPAEAAQLDVWGQYLGVEAYRVVGSPVPADWTADLAAVPDTAAGEYGTLTPPLEHGGHVVLLQVDDDGDATEAHVELPAPRMHIRVDHDDIALVDFVEGQDVSVEVTWGTESFGPWTAVPEWQPSETTEAHLNVAADVDIEPGMVVTATQGGITKQHTVTTAVFTETTDPSSTPPVVEFTVDPGQGVWNVLQGFGENGSVAQYEYDVSGMTEPWTHAVALGHEDAMAVNHFGQVDPPLQFAWLDQVDEDGDSTVAQWGTVPEDEGGGGEPWIGAVVWPDTHLFGEEFTGMNLLVEVDSDPADGPEYALDLPVGTYEDGIHYDGQHFELRAPFWEDWDPGGAGPWHLAPGDVVTVTAPDDPGLAKQLVVGDIAITGTDQPSATVTGTAPEGAEVLASRWGDDMGNPHEDVLAVATGGSWSATFSSMRAGSGGWGMLVDDDGDGTAAVWGAPMLGAGIDVDGPDGLADDVWGAYWYLDDNVTVTVERAGEAEPVFTNTVPVQLDWWRGFGGGLEGFEDLQVGDVVRVAGDRSGTVLQHTVLNVAVDYSLFEEGGGGNEVFGSAHHDADGTLPAEGLDVLVEVDDEFTENHAHTIVGGDGGWGVDYDDLPDGVQINEGSGGVVSVLDATGNRTFAPWGHRGGGDEGEPPTIFATAYGFEYVEGVGWDGLEPLTVDVTGTCTASVEVGFEEEPGNFFLPAEQLGEDCDLSPGDTITVTGGGVDPVQKSLTISDLVVTGVDKVTDTVSGLGDAESEILLDAWLGDDVPPLELPITVAGDGTWVADLGASDVDLDVGDPNGAVHQWDEDGDATRSEWFVANPHLIANPAQDVAILGDWPSGESAALTVRTADGGLLLHQVDVPLPGPYFVVGGAWVDLDGFDLQPGHWIEASAGAATRGFEVSPVHVTDVDFAAATVSGVAGPGAPGFVGLENDTGGCEAEFTSDASGAWSVDLGVACPDLAIGTHVEGAAGEVMLDAGEFQGVTFVFWSADHVAEPIVGGGTVSSGDGTVDEGDPVETSVTAPAGATSGEITITETTVTGDVAVDYVLLGSQVAVTTNVVTGGEPFELTFLLDASVIPDGEDASTIMVFRDGEAVPECADVPDGTYPCVAARSTDAVTGDVTITVLTDGFSTWTLGVPVLQLGDVSAPGEPRAAPADLTLSVPYTDRLETADDVVTWTLWSATSDPIVVDGTVGGGIAAGSFSDVPAGVYVVGVTLVDTTTGATATTSYQYVVVYDPSGGFVTGGGWFASPAGAFPADPDLTGPATFGFVAKYHKGADVPEGSTEFQFHAGDLDFHSTSYDWLVVAGRDRARFKGEGSINGVGGYQFMLTAVDGEPDTFRIKIWEESTGDVVYDNGAVDEGGTPLGGGSVVVHTKGR